MAGFDLLTNLDMHGNQLLNAIAQLLAADPGSPVEGRFYANNVDHTLHFYNGTAWIVLGRLDQISAPTASVAMNSQKFTGLLDGTNPQDSVTKAQLDAAVAGLKWKAAVRAATSAAGTLASSFENGDVIDGVTLATGDRILIKDQASGGENGIYTVNASGAPTRGTDADSAAEILQAAVFVQEGTANADTGWVNTTNAPITLGTTATVWAQFTGATVTAGAGLTSSGSTINAIAGAAVVTGGPGGGLKVAADDIAIDKDVVGIKYAADIGDGSSTSITVTHNLGSKDVTVAVFDLTTPFAEVHPEVRHTSTTALTLVFAVAPTSAQYRAVVKY